MPNTDNLTMKGKGRGLTTEEAQKIGSAGGKASVKARAEKKLLKDEILKRMTETDWAEMIDGLVARAKDSDKAFELLRDTIGQKPTEKVEADTKLEIVMPESMSEWAE